MTHLLELSNELLLSIASFLRKVDLLNVALVCKFLRETTEPELCRVYHNPQLYGQSISLFVLRLIRRPDLIPHVKKLELKGWDTLENMHPQNHEVISATRSVTRSFRRDKADSFGQHLRSHLEPSEEEYIALTEVAKSTGVIQAVFPYEHKSHILEKVRPMLCLDIIPDLHWDTFIYNDMICADEIPFDRKFCQQLRAGIEEAYAILLVCMVGLVKTIIFREVGPQSGTRSGLPWPLPKHRFQRLQHLRAGSTEGGLSWGIGYLDTILSSAVNLKHIRIHNSSSWFPNSDLFESTTLPLEERIVRCNLRPGSLPNVTKLELTYCMMARQDMQPLLRACPQLKSLYYTSYFTDLMDEDIINFSPGVLIKLLQPFQSTLQELHVDIDPGGTAWWQDYDVNTSYIVSLRNFTALHTLITDPLAWLEYADVGADIVNVSEPLELSLGNGLCALLPPGLKRLYFLGQYIDMDYENIRDIIESRRQLLPDLTEMLIEVRTDEAATSLQEELYILVEGYGCDVENLDIKYGMRGDMAPLMLNPFAGEIPCRNLPHVRWFGQKYSTRKRKEHRALTLFTKLFNLYDGESFSSAEISRRIIDENPDLEEAFKDLHKDTGGPRDSQRELERYESESDDSEN